MEVRLFTFLVFAFLRLFTFCVGQNEGAVRLVGGSYYEGTVEVFHNGLWGTICDDSWHYRDADVVCKQLGYDRAYRLYYRAYYGQGQGPIWIDQINCPSSAKTLLDCSPSPSKWGEHDCTKREDAGVKCLRKFPRKPQFMHLRLSCPQCTQNGQCSPCPKKIHPSPTDCSVETAVEGIVFAQYNNEWYPVTGEGWDVNAAQVVCKELGYPIALPSPSLSELWTNWDGKFIDNDSCGLLGGTVAYPECSMSESLGSGGSSVDACKMEVEENSEFRDQLKKRLLSRVYCEGVESKLLNCYFQEFGPFESPELSESNVATVRCALKPHVDCTRNDTSEVGHLFSLFQPLWGKGLMRSCFVDNNYAQQFLSRGLMVSMEVSASK